MLPPHLRLYYFVRSKVTMSATKHANLRSEIVTCMLRRYLIVQAKGRPYSLYHLTTMNLRNHHSKLRLLTSHRIITSLHSLPHTTSSTHPSKNSLIASLTSSAFSNIRKCPDSICCTLKSGAYGRVEPSAAAGVPMGSLDAVSRSTGFVRLAAEGGIADIMKHINSWRFRWQERRTNRSHPQDSSYGRGRGSG